MSTADYKDRPQVQFQEESQSLDRRVELAIAAVEALTNPVIGRIEAKSPGHPLGKSKDNHMKNMAEDSISTAALIGLSYEDGLLLRFVFRTHDIGRFVETDQALDTLRPGARHGQLSFEFLDETLNKYFTTEEASIVSFAIVNHSENLKVFQDNLAHFTGIGRETAEAICYLLRDMDSMERLQNSQKFLTPEGIFEQLKAHYTNFKQPNALSVQPGSDKVCTSFIKELIADSNATSPDELNPQTAVRIRDIINGHLSRDAIRQFRKHQELAIDEVYFSYANYMLLQIAIIFQTHHPALLEEIYQKRETYLMPRLHFLKKKLTSAEFSEVISVLTDFFAEKLNYERLGTKDEIAAALTA